MNLECPAPFIQVSLTANGTKDAGVDQPLDD